MLEGGKGLSIMDVTTAGDRVTRRRITDSIVPGENYPNHEAIDFYHHYKEDIKLFGEMGLKFYDDMFDECHKYGIEPVITLSHFEIPLHLVKWAWCL